MAWDALRRKQVNWRWGCATVFFFCAFFAFASGVSVSERPEIVSESLLTKAYYSLGLFVMGGMDLGTPIDGHPITRAMLWLAFFGSPILAASAVIEAVVHVISPDRWQFRRLKNHIVVVGSDELSISYLRVLREHDTKVKVVLVDNSIEVVRQQELQQAFNVAIVIGDITHEYLLDALQLKNARKVVLLGDDSLDSFEAATKILKLYPNMAHKILLHCHNLRFMRAMADTLVANKCTTFNSYHLAAHGLFNNHLMQHFKDTSFKDVVILAGFGRFGQTILEALQNYAEDEIDTVAIIDVDAERRILVAEEQTQLNNFCRKEIFQGDIAHPDVWRQLRAKISLDSGEPVVILGTGRVEENLRTALWIKNKFPNCKVFARTNHTSVFAGDVSDDHQILSISITQLVEENLPKDWLG